MLCHCLTLENPEDWNGFSFVAMVRLSVNERASLAYAALNSLDRSDAEKTASAAIDPAGNSTDLGLLGEARFWASYAKPDQIKAYALACFQAMAPEVQASFLKWAQREGAR